MVNLKLFELYHCLTNECLYGQFHFSKGWISTGDSMLALPDMPLPDEDAGLVDTLGQPKLENLCLKSPLHEVLNPKTENVIKLHLRLIQHTNSHKPTQERITCG